MFWFLLIALVAVVGAVTLVVVGGGDGGALPEAQPDRLLDPLPEDRPVDRTDVEALRLPLALRGYRMAEVDDALGRLGAELAERDARIAELEAALAGTQATAYGGPGLIGEFGGAPGAVLPVPDAAPTGPAGPAARPERSGHGAPGAGAVDRPDDGTPVRHDAPDTARDGSDAAPSERAAQAEWRSAERVEERQADHGVRPGGSTASGQPRGADQTSELDRTGKSRKTVELDKNDELDKDDEGEQG